jgi:hypothetical protein
MYIFTPAKKYAQASVGAPLLKQTGAKVVLDVWTRDKGTVK